MVHPVDISQADKGDVGVVLCLDVMDNSDVIAANFMEDVF